MPHGEAANGQTNGSSHRNFDRIDDAIEDFSMVFQSFGQCPPRATS